MIRRTLLLLLALVLVAGIAACGGGGDDDAAGRSDADTAADGGAGGRADDAAAGAESAGDADGAVVGGGDGVAPPAAEGEPGAVATELGVDRTFTGEGSDAFCAEVVALEEATGGTQVDEAALADQMAAIEAPDEIADEWTNLTTVQKAIASDPSGEALAAMSDEETAAWGMSGAVVAAYLGDVCGME